jgi:hypothetical protein
MRGVPAAAIRAIANCSTTVNAARHSFADRAGVPRRAPGEEQGGQVVVWMCDLLPSFCGVAARVGDRNGRNRSSDAGADLTIYA